MLSNFATELAIFGCVEVIDIEEIQEIHGNKNITVKAKTNRKRIDKNKELVCDNDIIPLKFWSSGAEYVKDHVSVGDILQIRGQIRGRYPNIDLRVMSFEILNMGLDAAFEKMLKELSQEQK